MVEVGGVFYVGFLAISFFEDFSQAFSLGAVDELVGYDVGECGSEGYAQDDEGGFDAVLHGEHEFIGGQCMDTDDGEEEAVEEDAGDEGEETQPVSPGRIPGHAGCVRRSRGRVTVWQHL